MILPILVDDVQRIQTKLQSNNKLLTNVRFRSGKSKEYLNFHGLSKSEVAAFKDVIYAKAERGDKHYTTVKRKFDEWEALLTDVGNEKPVKKLDLLPAAIKAWFGDKAHKWVFIQDPDDDSMNPYFITDCQYQQAHYDSHGNYIPAQVHLSAKAWRRGNKMTQRWTFYKQNLGVSVPKILAAAKLYPETEKAVEQYRSSYSKYVKLQDQTGLQMQAIGAAETVSSSRWYSSDMVEMVREGIPTKVVVDDDDSRERSDDVFVIDGFWEDIPDRNGMAGLSTREILEVIEESEDEELEESFEPNRVELPIHPYLRIFDMLRHEYLTIHAGNLQDYPWDKTLINKLVIKDTDKQLIDLMMNQTGAKMEDIIRGKMGGVIVLATGVPGIGKTLTAEVFSEAIERPLYTVQCSQLGLNVDAIEKNLSSILERAARWNAILLIDEADVYIRRRGDDITQNAIVGVFLRLIEYYRGVLFMTSNRGDVIDDAIISRASAWIKYETPDEKNLAQIFKVLGDQYNAQLTDTEAKKLAKQYLGISGRTVRNLLKLARMLAGDGKITLEMINTAAQYQMTEV